MLLLLELDQVLPLHICVASTRDNRSTRLLEHIFRDDERLLLPHSHALHQLLVLLGMDVDVNDIVMVNWL